MGFNLPQFNIKWPFTKTKELSLGLDIGSHAVKMCEMTDTGHGYTLLSLGSSLLPDGAVEEGVLQDPEAVAKVITNLRKNLKVKGHKAAISISGYSVIVKKISLTTIGEENIEAHIHAEAEQYIPFDIEDVYLDYQRLPSNSAKDDGRTDIMLVAAKKEVVDSYLSMLLSAGLTAVVVDVDAFALENVYEGNYGLDENVALVDIGASKMNINIISRGASILARDVAIGSRQLTKNIQNRFDIDFTEAEALKIGQIEAGDRKGALEDIFISTTTQWITEIKRALDFYYSNYPDEPIARIALSGGGTRIRGLDSFIGQETELAVDILNPFQKVNFSPDKIDPEYLQYIGQEMAISVGLASRPVEL